MDTDFPITRPTTEDEFRRALEVLIESADKSGIDPGVGWGFRTDWNGWSIEILRLKSSAGEPTDPK